MIIEQKAKERKRLSEDIADTTVPTEIAQVSSLLDLARNVYRQ